MNPSQVLRCAASATLALAAVTRAFDTSVGTVKPVAEADRVSKTQLFRRDIDVTFPLSTPDLAFVDIDIDVPGRVYITHVDDPTTGNFANVIVSGSTEGAVEYVTFEPSAGEPEDLVISTKMGNYTATSSDALLVEVQLFVKNSLRSLAKKGSSDAVVLEDVLYPAAGATTNATDSFTAGSEISVVYGNGSIFISDPKAEVSPSALTLRASAQGSSSIQVELAKLTQTNGENINVALGEKNKITLLVDELGPVTATYSDEASQTANNLCISSKADVKVTSELAEGTTQTPSVRSKGATCTKTPLPTKEPVPIRDDLTIPGTPSATTPAPAGASSSAATLAAFGSVVTLALAVLL